MFCHHIIKAKNIKKLKRLVLDSLCLPLQMGSPSLLPNPVPGEADLQGIHHRLSAGFSHGGTSRGWSRAGAMCLHGSTELSESQHLLHLPACSHLPGGTLPSAPGADGFSDLASPWKLRHPLSGPRKSAHHPHLLRTSLPLFPERTPIQSPFLSASRSGVTDS